MTKNWLRIPAAFGARSGIFSGRADDTPGSRQPAGSLRERRSRKMNDKGSGFQAHKPPNSGDGLGYRVYITFS
jgi:hypothetical protein